MFPNLRAEMAREKLTAVSMAPKLDMNERTLGNKLSGKTEFTWKEIRLIRSIFFPNCTLEYLFDESEHQNTA